MADTSIYDAARRYANIPADVWAYMQRAPTIDEGRSVDYGASGVPGTADRNNAWDRGGSSMWETLSAPQRQWVMQMMGMQSQQAPGTAPMGGMPPGMMPPTPPMQPGAPPAQPGNPGLTMAQMMMKPQPQMPQMAPSAAVPAGSNPLMNQLAGGGQNAMMNPQMQQLIQQYLQQQQGQQGLGGMQQPPGGGLP